MRSPSQVEDCWNCRLVIPTKHAPEKTEGRQQRLFAGVTKICRRYKEKRGGLAPATTVDESRSVVKGLHDLLGHLLRIAE